MNGILLIYFKSANRFLREFSKELDIRMLRRVNQMSILCVSFQILT
jgi:hypothetical protein